MESKGGGYYKRAPQTREGGRKGRRRGRSDGGGHLLSPSSGKWHIGYPWSGVVRKMMLPRPYATLGVGGARGWSNAITPAWP